MFQIKIFNDYMILNGGSSDGMQIKYFKDGYWYKTDAFGSEGMIEYLVSGVLKYTNLKPNEFVSYDMGYINSHPGCKCKNFLKSNEIFITCNRLHKNVNGVGMNVEVNKLNTLEKKVSYVVDFIKDICEIDVTDYLRKIFTLDYIILNEDRHFNNLGIIMSEDNKYYAAPIFDNGKSLFCGNFSIKENLGFEENFKRVTCQPFGFCHRKIYEYFGPGFTLDKKGAINWLSEQSSLKERDILRYRIENILL